MVSARLRILIVEDEGMIAMLLEDMVEELGHAVAGVAANLQTGLAQARDLPIDMAILDVNLGGAISHEVAETLASRGVPFVVSSGYGSAIVHPAFVGWPVISKPFQQQELAEKIALALRTGMSARPSP